MDHRQSLLLLLHMVVVMTGAVKSEPTLTDLLQVRCPSDHPFMCLPYGACCTGSQFCHSGLCESCFPKEIPEGHLLSWCRDAGQYNVSLMRSDACRLACQDKFSSAELAVTRATARKQYDENVSAPSYGGARPGDDVTECECTAYMAVMITSVLISVALVFLMILTRIRKRRSVTKSSKRIYKGKENEVKPKKQGSNITNENEVFKPTHGNTKSTQNTKMSKGGYSQCRTNDKLVLHGSASGETKSGKGGERRLSESEEQGLNQSNHSFVSQKSPTAQSSVPPVNVTDDHMLNAPEGMNQGMLESDVVVNVDMENESRGLKFESENSGASTDQLTNDEEHETSNERNEAETKAPSDVQSSLTNQLPSGSVEGEAFERDCVTVPEAMAVAGDGPRDNGGVNVPQTMAGAGDGPGDDDVHLEGSETVQEPSATMSSFEDNPSSDFDNDKGDERGLLEGDVMPLDIYTETVDLNRKGVLRVNMTAGGTG